MNFTKDHKLSYKNHEFTLIVYYDTNYGNTAAFECKYCYMRYGKDEWCISDNEKIIKDLLE
jgi:hypothetical protein